MPSACRFVVLCMLVFSNGLSLSLFAQPNELPPTTVQQPTFGVSVDASGVLRNAVFANVGNPQLPMRRAAAINPREDHQASSECRKLSLQRLEAEILRQHADSKSVDESILHLAGLQRIDYLFICPEQQDIVIAGPAGGWETDGAGRVVGTESGHPVILLEDLLVALRTFQAHSGALPWIGCSIDPTATGLKRFVEFSRTIPSQVPVATRDLVAQQIVSGSQSSLGMADVHVFGIANDTHLARVLVEADYRMKLIGLGLEPPPVRMATFIDQMRRAPRQIQRWWFTPDVHRLSIAPDGLAVQFVGAGVKLSTENVAWGPGQRDPQPRSKPSAASRRYAEAFTKKYDQIADISPVYWQLRSAIDLLVAAAWLQHVDADRHLAHPPLSLIDESVVSVHGWQVPRQAACVANAVWKGQVLIAPVGGGVSIAVTDALKAENTVTYQDTSAIRQGATANEQNWWWDDEGPLRN